MTLRFLTGVAIAAAVATGLVKRYQRQQAIGRATPDDQPTLPLRPRPLTPNQAAAATPDPTGTVVIAP